MSSSGAPAVSSPADTFNDGLGGGGLSLLRRQKNSVTIGLAKVFPGTTPSPSSRLETGFQAQEFSGGNREKAGWKSDGCGGQGFPGGLKL